MNRRTIAIGLTSLAAAATVLWMQHKFEAGDAKNALRIVQRYRPHGTSIPELIEQRHPTRPVDWSTATESACYQHVRVHAVVSSHTDAAEPKPHLYAFTVDINGPVIHPANELGRELLAGLEPHAPKTSAVAK